ncbi:unnamed protein product [Bursaphelenchus xylophilus]|uniref:(pine wood nematode) hypothetical protein n=1 Tax=Bursaphelenchus xylophilus TaxID=6326 RepID=A0A1I7S923_BURXY|nr:unnamed protein product [Bursaphelenchus xylophilus]CAG9086168.1 unnamed protein product [Bursaphelenchus xylophilus]
MPSKKEIRESKETQAYEKFCEERNRLRELGEDSEAERSNKTCCCVHGGLCEVAKQKRSSTYEKQLNEKREPEKERSRPIKAKKSSSSGYMKAKDVIASNYRNSYREKSTEKKKNTYAPSHRASSRVRKESEKSEDKVHGLGYAYQKKGSLEDSCQISDSKSLPAKSPATLALTRKAGSLRPRVEKYTLEKRLDPLLDYYIGDADKADAEKGCPNPGSFRIYHCCPSEVLNNYDGLLAGIPLFMVYHGSDGVFRHWPILTRKRTNNRRQLYVGISFTDRIYFDTLAGLVYFYARCVSLFKDDDSKIPDLFPIWLDHGEDAVTVKWEINSDSC